MDELRTCHHILQFGPGSPTCGLTQATIGREGQRGYVAEKAEGDTGWLSPVGDEVASLGYVAMFQDMFNSMDKGVAPTGTVNDGYIVNTIIDACYKPAESKKMGTCRYQGLACGAGDKKESVLKEYDSEHYLIKEEKMPNGNLKTILKHKQTGAISQAIKA